MQPGPLASQSSSRNVAFQFRTVRCGGGGAGAPAFTARGRAPAPVPPQSAVGSVGEKAG